MNIRGKYTNLGRLDYNRVKTDTIYLIYTGNSRNSAKYLFNIVHISKGSITVCNNTGTGTNWEVSTKNGSVPFIVANCLGNKELRNILTEEDYSFALNYNIGNSINFRNFYNQPLDSLIESTSKVEMSDEEMISSVNKVNPIKQKESKMKKMNKFKDNVVEANKSAATVAAQLTAGTALNKAVIKKLKPQLPLMVRGYADHALAQVLVANAASFAVTQFAEDNEKAQWAAEAMMAAAMTDFLRNFDISAIISEMVDNVVDEVPKKTKKDKKGE